MFIVLIQISKSVQDLKGNRFAANFDHSEATDRNYGTERSNTLHREGRGSLKALKAHIAMEESILWHSLFHRILDNRLDSKTLLGNEKIEKICVKPTLDDVCRALGFESLRPDQKEGLLFLENNSKSSVCLIMATGSGKSDIFIGYTFLCRKKRPNDNLKSLVLCPYVAVLEEWVRNINYYYQLFDMFIQNKRSINSPRKTSNSWTSARGVST